MDVIGRLVQWGANQPLVRAMLLESSRASERAPVDILSDYDVLLVVSDTRPFSKDETWLQDFGKILGLFRDKGRIHGLTTYNRLVLSEDGTKIDYIVWTVALLQRILGAPRLPDLLDQGYQVLVDKDHLAHRLKSPTFTELRRRMPLLSSTGRNAAFLIWGKGGRGYFINSRLLTIPVKNGTLVL